MITFENKAKTLLEEHFFPKLLKKATRYNYYVELAKTPAYVNSGFIVVSTKDWKSLRAVRRWEVENFLKTGLVNIHGDETGRFYGAARENNPIIIRIPKNYVPFPTFTAKIVSTLIAVTEGKLPISSLPGKSIAAPVGFIDSYGY